jgi:hypothetical protein
MVTGTAGILSGFALLLSVPVATLHGQQRTLVIDRVLVNETPQSGTWLMCFTAQSGEVENTFNVPDRNYSGDGVTIRMNLQLSPVNAGDKVDFSMYLDDDQSSVCADSAEDKSADSFQAGSGSKRVNRDSFNYIVYDSMK